MATLVLDDCEIYVNDYDLTGATNQVQLSGSADVLDTSTFASAGWREHIQGTRMVDWTAGGPWGFEDPDDETWNHINAPQTVPGMTVASTSTEGDVAYFWQPTTISRDVGGSYGDVPLWTLNGKTGGTFGEFFRGGLSMAKQTITGDTNGTAVELSNLNGDVNDPLAVLIHVFSDNATSMDVIIERDDNSGFTTATTVATEAVTGVGQQWVYSLGLFLASDTFYRVRTANLVGTNFEIAVAIGTSIAEG